MTFTRGRPLKLPKEMSSKFTSQISTWRRGDSPDEGDYVELTDGDGSFLGRFGARHYVDEEGSGEGSGDEGPGEMIRISDITSNTETVHVLFHTDASVTRSGWRLEWSK